MASEALRRFTVGSVDPQKSLAPDDATQRDVGFITIGVADESFEVAAVEHWVEDGVHHFAGVEFDCFAEDPDELRAARKFIENTEDLLRYLDDLYDAGRATPAEVDILVKLSRRFLDLHHARDRLLERRRLTDFFRRPASIERAAEWHAQPPAATDSSALSHAWTGDPGRSVRHGVLFRVESPPRMASGARSSSKSTTTARSQPGVLSEILPAGCS